MGHDGRPADVPAMPLRLELPPCVIASSSRVGDPGWRPDVMRKEREATPPELAAWLVELARMCCVGAVTEASR